MSLNTQFAMSAMMRGIAAVWPESPFSLCRPAIRDIRDRSQPDQSVITGAGCERLNPAGAVGEWRRDGPLRVAADEALSKLTRRISTWLFLEDLKPVAFRLQARDLKEGR